MSKQANCQSVNKLLKYKHQEIICQTSKFPISHKLITYKHQQIISQTSKLSVKSANGQSVNKLLTYKHHEIVFQTNKLSVKQAICQSINKLEAETNALIFREKNVGYESDYHCRSPWNFPKELGKES